MHRLSTILSVNVDGQLLSLTLYMYVISNGLATAFNLNYDTAST